MARRRENYQMISERETRSGYADIAMIVRPDRRKYKFPDVLIEFRFIRRIKDLKLTRKQIVQKTDQELWELEKVKEKADEAKEQAVRYSADLKTEFGDVMQLKTFVVIAVGFERIVWRMIR